MLDVRESLLLEVEIQNFKEGSCMSGFGSNQKQLEKKKKNRKAFGGRRKV